MAQPLSFAVVVSDIWISWKTHFLRHSFDLLKTFLFISPFKHWRWKERPGNAMRRLSYLFMSTFSCGIRDRQSVTGVIIWILYNTSPYLRIVLIVVYGILKTQIRLLADQGLHCLLTKEICNWKSTFLKWQIGSSFSYTWRSTQNKCGVKSRGRVKSSFWVHRSHFSSSLIWIFINIQLKQLVVVILLPND